jgi:hypothetical protein
MRPVTESEVKGANRIFFCSTSGLKAMGVPNHLALLTHPESNWPDFMCTWAPIHRWAREVYMIRGPSERKHADCLDAEIMAGAEARVHEMAAATNRQLYRYGDGVAAKGEEGQGIEEMLRRLAEYEDAAAAAGDVAFSQDTDAWAGQGLSEEYEE